MKTRLTIAVLFFAAFASSASSQTALPSPPSPPPIPIPESKVCCPTTLIYQRGIADNFALPIDPTNRSLALDAFLQSVALPNLPPVAYDDPSGCDHPFGDTFTVDECVLCHGICSATLEITLRGCGSGLDCNDSLTIGQAPFNTGGYVIWNGYINGVGCPNDPPIGTDTPPPVLERAAPGGRRPIPTATATVVKTIQLDPRKLTELVCHRNVHELDVYVQDDQQIDFMRLIITKP